MPKIGHFSSNLRGLNLYFTTELRQMMSHDIVKNISKLEKQVAKFRETVYTKDRSKCLPLADGAGYK